MVKTDSIPAELRNTPQWVLWKYEAVKGNRTKVLYNPQNFRASSTGSNTWVSFDRAYKRYYSALTQKDTEDVEVIRYDGIGFVLSAEDDFVAWDFDHCVENGKVAEPAASYIKRLDSYTEISPSGTGIRVLTRGKLPPHGRKKGPFETYESKRFVTITGNHLAGTSEEIQSRPQEILALHLDIFGDAPAPVVAAPYVGSPVIAEDESLIEIAKAADNGWKFTEMFSLGNIGEFPSKSEARMSLCGTLAFYAGPNPERIDRLFRQSALFDEKWDSKRGDLTYGADTISKVLEGRTEYYGMKAGATPDAPPCTAQFNGIPFWPQNGVTMTQRTVSTGRGKDKETETVDLTFANFTLRVIGLLRKAAFGREVWRCLLNCKGREVEVEFDRQIVTSAEKVAALKNWPTSAVVAIPALWPSYLGWLADNIESDDLIEEVSFYGLHDLDTSPTLVLPGCKHPKYAWRNDGEGKDPAFQDLFPLQDDPEETARYLTGLRDNLLGVHEDRYVYTLLAWLCCCPLSGSLRRHQTGFPPLMISGLSESGKSTLVEALMHHIGTREKLSVAAGSAGTSIAAIKRILGATNLLPVVLDEYREHDERHVATLAGIIRDASDGQGYSFVSGKEIESGKYVTPFIMLGQAHITDGAALSRSVSVRLDRQFVETLKANPQLEQAAVKQLTWIQRPKHKGLLLRALVTWIFENPEAIQDIIAYSEELVAKHSHLKMRRAEAYTAVTAGLVLLVQVYKKYGIATGEWLKPSRFMPAIFAADPEIEGAKLTDTSTMQELFNITDKGILAAKNKGMALTDVLVLDDTEPSGQKYSCPRYAYFDAKRWYSTILQEYNKKGNINLQNEATFYAMLGDQARQEDTAIVSFGIPHGSFRKNCVKVDLDKIIDLYSINAEGWHSELESEDY